jgi:hypothetical protein
MEKRCPTWMAIEAVNVGQGAKAAGVRAQGERIKTRPNPAYFPSSDLTEELALRCRHPAQGKAISRGHLRMNPGWQDMALLPATFPQGFRGLFHWRSACCAVSVRFSPYGELYKELSQTEMNVPDCPFTKLERITAIKYRKRVLP